MSNAAVTSYPVAQAPLPAPCPASAGTAPA